MWSTFASRFGYTAEPLAKWITERTGIAVSSASDWYIFASLLSLLDQISIMRPPNYTLLMIWIPVIILASVIGYMKRENLYMLYDTKYWAAAAMVCA